MYAPLGRPSIAPEQLLRALLSQAFYSIRSERQLMERLEFDLLSRWFAGLGVDEAVWDHSTFSKNRDRLLAGEVAGKFLAGVLGQGRVSRLLSSEHFSVDGTMIEAWASMKSLRRKDGGDRRRAGQTAAGATKKPTSGARSVRMQRMFRPRTPTPSSTARAWSGSQLFFLGHALMENRSGLFVDARLTRVSGHAAARRWK